MTIKFMREFKFRFWDGDSLRYSDDFNSFEAFFAFADDKGYEDFRNIWQQFTGLLDKNDKEIYEGDIIEFHRTPSGQGREFYFVDFEKGSFRFKNKYTNIPIRWDYSIEWEIVGNIFENPELLK